MFGRGRGKFLVAMAACVWALAMSAGAQANTIGFGGVLSPTFTSAPIGQVETQFNTALAEKGASVSSPATGAVVRWRIQGAKGGPFYLRVLHPNGSGGYTAMGKSAAATPTSTGVQTFDTNLPIHSGDLIAIDSTNPTDEIGVSTVAGGNTAFIFPTAFEGSTNAPSGTGAGQELQLSAEVQPAPVVKKIAPASGSLTGGTKVVITGENLAGASAVKFGEVAATGFTVNSDGEITATAPKGTKRGRVDVAVTTVAGTSVAVDTDAFIYASCVVPRLTGKKLSAAKVALRRAGCSLGAVKKVRSARAKHAKVVATTPGAGKTLAPGAKVGLKVGR
jgi:hypothetical protein